MTYLVRSVIFNIFLNFLRVSGTFAVALLEQSFAGIPLVLANRESSPMKIGPASPAWHGR
jgi:hypothetical protein